MSYVTVDQPQLHARQLRKTKQSLEATRWPYHFLLPVMNLMALQVRARKHHDTKAILPINHRCFDGLSEQGRRVKEGAGLWPALDVVYNFDGSKSNHAVERIFDNIWLRMRNAQAVRNRKQIAQKLLRDAFIDLRDRLPAEEPIRILSLASGSAQVVLEVVKEFTDTGTHVEVLLIDDDSTAIAYAKKLAERLGVSAFVRTIKGNVLRFDSLISGYVPDIVEMMGLLDYVKTGLAAILLRKIKSVIKQGGYFFSCHIHPNAEAFFLKWVVNWDMLYRTVEEFAELLEKGGFGGAALFTEPQRIHSVAVARV